MIQLSFATDRENSGVILFDRESGEELGRYPFADEPQVGNIHELTIPGYSPEEVSYLFYEDGKPVPDKKAMAFAGADTFGKAKHIHMYRGILPQNAYDWEGDTFPKLPAEECIMYCMHVRGFTMHESSNVEARGTFAGIVEKLPYLKELGVTTLELQPAYEFPEYPISFGQESVPEHAKINYWGYTEGFYYTPKRAYAYSEDATVEFKDMVKALHQNGMELVMQFYFPESFPVTEIGEVLRFWHGEYHVDGFHLKGNDLPVSSLATDACLYNAKLLYESFEEKKLERVSGKRKQRLAIYNDFYLQRLRSFLKSDNSSLLPAVKSMFKNGIGVNYLSNYYGFTMLDMVSYQEKHNEANGEDNHDGSNYHLTWNCGAEGVCYKIEVQVLRERQLRNAFALLFVSRGIPLIFMGDEFGNTQWGNNNPYCQDNDITWLNWENLKRHEGLHAYVKQLMHLRKENSALSLAQEAVKAQWGGLPAMSYHGAEAWKLSLEENTLHLGILLNGEGSMSDHWYVAINMHWEKQCLALPSVNKNTAWELVCSTEGSLKEISDTHQITLEPRSISLFCIRK